MTGLGFIQKGTYSASTRARPQGSAHMPAHAELAARRMVKRQNQKMGQRKMRQVLSLVAGRQQPPHTNPTRPPLPQELTHDRDKQKSLMYTKYTV